MPPRSLLFPVNDPIISGHNSRTGKSEIYGILSAFSVLIFLVFLIMHYMNSFQKFFDLLIKIDQAGFFPSL